MRSGKLPAEEVRRLLELERHATCGFVRLTFTSKQSIPAGALPAPFSDARPLGSALYFMVTPQAPVRLHRIRNDQLYHMNYARSTPPLRPTCAPLRRDDSCRGGF